MKIKTMGLAWIPVNDFKKAITFYTEILGLKVLESNEEWGWAELAGHDGGSRIGISHHTETPAGNASPVKPGQNAVLSFDVANLEEAVAELQKKGVKLIGDIEVIPDHVKMQMVQDVDGNFIHLVEMLLPQDHEHSKDEHHGGCCGGH